MTEQKKINEAIAPAISAGLGALMLRNKVKALSEANGETGSTILNFGNSGSYASPSAPSSGTHDDKAANTSAMKIEGNPNGTGFAQKTTKNIFTASTKDPTASTIVGIPNMPPSSS